jgi:trans-aconitate methyltransferase
MQVSSVPAQFDATSADSQLACAKYLKWHIGSCTISISEIAITGWALRYPLDQEYSFLLNGKPFATLEWPLDSPALANVFNLIPGAEKGNFSCGNPISDREDLFRTGFARFDFVTEQGKHAQSYRHAWFQPDPENAGPIPEMGRVKRVIGVPDLESYLRGGATIACRLNSYLREKFDRSLSDFRRILDWGCGCARVTRHLRVLASPDAVTGIDIDGDNVAWCRENFPDTQFETIPLRPQTSLSDGQFDLAIGISVLTHLSEDVQFQWLEELQRITCKGAILLLSIQGPAQIAMQGQHLRYQRAIERGFYEHGRNTDLDGLLSEVDYYRAVIQSRDYIHSKFARYFDVLDIVDAIAGDQDLVVLRRR